ncbi:MAG: hypothetical protein M3Y80_07950 [Verrucomicrobiota bacterium]|nr:hypothetical protein [Verrucomicrobiota bacterium]
MPPRRALKHQAAAATARLRFFILLQPQMRHAFDQYFSMIRDGGGFRLRLMHRFFYAALL